jgi:AcrR family transcriptional regulator
VREPVKGKTEAGRRREERARLTRQRIIAAARGLFLERGFTATTVEAVAAEAGVAPATPYQAFGTKRAILAAVLESTVAGDDAPTAVLDRDWVAAARRERNPKKQLRMVVAGACEIAARTAPLKDVIRDAAATDPAAGELIRLDHQRRRQTQASLVEILTERRPLRADVKTDRAVDTFFALVNSVTYDLLVNHCGLSVEQWKDWLVDLLERQLFGPCDRHDG